MALLTIKNGITIQGLILVRQFEEAKNFLGPKMPHSAFLQRLDFEETLSWPQNATFCILAGAYYGETLSPLPLKLSLCQNAKSGISGPRKFFGYLQSASPK